MDIQCPVWTLAIVSATPEMSVSSCERVKKNLAWIMFNPLIQNY